MRVAIFGGSFDPVHNEHVRLVEHALSSLELDKLIVMPANVPPHKRGGNLSSGEDRLAMCRLAFAHLDKVEISDYEIVKGGTSYTFETCRHFKASYPQNVLFWLVGSDMLLDFPAWKNPEDILENVTLGVCARAERANWILTAQTDFEQRFGKRFAVVNYNGAPVSSTTVRALAGAGMDLIAYVPVAVDSYIREKGLYAVPYAKEALALQNPSRRAHSVRVAKYAVAYARALGLDEKQVITATLFHDCAKNLDENHPLLKDFQRKTEWGEIPSPVLHQFTGAYLAETQFGIRDEDVVNAIRYHTSGRAGMSTLEKLVFVADMLEEGRDFHGVDELRALLAEEGVPVLEALERCLTESLRRSIQFVKEKGGTFYPLTERAYAYYKGENYGKQRKQ